MIILNGFSHVVIIINGNMLLLMILIVVSSIFEFVRYYIESDVSNGNFKLLKLLFLRLIVLILTSFGILMFLRWEGIGVMSMCLIRY
jgi:NADH:ubiquinone oxidoreductase subunit 5 (subunit L)/multisubunit Na+/H+ antiporter MnhA subunit